MHAMELFFSYKEQSCVIFREVDATEDNHISELSHSPQGDLHVFSPLCVLTFT